MAASVQSLDLSRITTSGTGLVTITGAWTWGAWVKVQNYPSGAFTQVMSLHDAGGTEFIGSDTNETSQTSLDFFTQINGGSFVPQSIITGSYVGWFFMSMSYPGSGNIYKCRIRKEGISTLTSFTVDAGAVVNDPTIFNLFSDGFASANTRLRSFFMQQVEMSDATLLTASSSLLAPAGTNTTFLALNDHTTAGTNTGTGANWTITGATLTTQADEPNPAVASGSVGSSAPTITGAATGKSLAAGAGSSAPLLTGSATGSWLSQAAGSSAPTLTVGATGRAAFAAAGSSAPTLTGGATSSWLSAGAGSSAPVTTAGATSAALKASAGSSSPPMTAAATGLGSVPGNIYFRDDFSGSSLDTTTWVAANRQGDPANGPELQCYVPSMVTVTGGELVITSEAHTQSCGDASNSPTSHAYRSGEILQVLAPFLYGTITFRVKMANGTGLWPIVWTLGAPWQAAAIATPGDANPPGASWDTSPWNEVDILEIFSPPDSGTVKQIIHNGGLAGGDVALGFDPTASYNTYQWTWTPGSAVWKVNGSVTKTITGAAVPSNPQFVLVSVAVGGNGGGGTIDLSTATPLRMDFIEVQSDTANASSAPTLTANATSATAASAGSSSPTLTAGATGSSRAAAAGSSSPTITGGATSAAVVAGAGSSSPAITGGATGQSTAAAAASSAPTLTADATGTSLRAGAGSSAPTLTSGATGQSKAAAAGACAPTLTCDASANTGSSVGSSSPTINASATGASLFAASGSALPTFTGGATSSWLSAGAGSSTPTTTADATGRSTAAGAGSSAPPITGAATATKLFAGAGSSAPTTTADATGRKLAAGAGSSSPSIAADATANTPGSQVSSSPTITANATGASRAAAAGAASPLLTGDAAGRALIPGAGSSNPTLTAGASGAAAIPGAASSAPVLTANATTRWAATASSSPIVNASATGASLASAIGSAVISMVANAAGIALGFLGPSRAARSGGKGNRSPATRTGERKDQ